MTRTRQRREAPKAQKAQEEPVLSGPEALILNYLIHQYRPYSTNDIIQNLHGEVTKAACVKALNLLSADGKIVCKFFGKALISCAPKIEVTAKDRKVDYDTVLRGVSLKVLETEEKLTEVQTELKEITQNPDIATLDKTIDELKAEIGSLKGLIQENQTTHSLTPESVITINAITEDVNKLTAKRYKMYKSFMKYLSEFLDPKDLATKLGLENPAPPQV